MWTAPTQQAPVAAGSPSLAALWHLALVQCACAVGRALCSILVRRGLAPHQRSTLCAACARIAPIGICRCLCWHCDFYDVWDEAAAMEAEEDREFRDISYPCSPVEEDFEYDTGDAWRADREQRQLDWEELYSQSLLANETATSDEIQAGWLDDSE